MARSRKKWGFWLWIFAGGREFGGIYRSVIGHRLRVGAMGVKGKAQEWCRLVWMGVEMWERGDSKWQRRLNVSCPGDRDGMGFWLRPRTTTFVGLVMNLVVGSI
jgi:hypothetical protein